MHVTHTVPKDLYCDDSLLSRNNGITLVRETEYYQSDAQILPFIPLWLREKSFSVQISD